MHRSWLSPFFILAQFYVAMKTLTGSSKQLHSLLRLHEGSDLAGAGEGRRGPGLAVLFQSCFPGRALRRCLSRRCRSESVVVDIRPGARGQGYNGSRRAGRSSQLFDLHLSPCSTCACSEARNELTTDGAVLRGSDPSQPCLAVFLPWDPGHGDRLGASKGHSCARSTLRLLAWSFNVPRLCGLELEETLHLRFCTADGTERRTR